MNGTPLFPAEIIARNQWCLWRIESGKNGRPTKVPHRPDGRKAASNNPATWSSFEVVSRVHRRQPDDYAGLGYFFSEGDPACGVDLDVCFNVNGAPHRWATEVIARFHDTYRALSVSGLGLHILCHAGLPANGRNFNVPDGPTDSTGKRAQIGLFDRSRFFALTGHLYEQSPLELADHQETIDWLLGLMQRQRWTKQVPPQPPSSDVDLSDSEIPDRARRAKNGAKFAKIWAGEWEGSYGSQSEADLALCCILAFWCGPDSSRIEALFRQSGLARDKWLEREDYRQNTIQAAIEKTQEFYKPGKPRSAMSMNSSAGAPPTLGTRPEVWVGARELHEMTADALTGLQQANDPPQLFARSGRMVAVASDERRRMVISALSDSSLRGRMARSAFYFKLGGKDSDQTIPCSPPLDVVRDLMALSAAEWKFPPLEALVEAPCMRPDGTICDRPGYDPPTFLFYAPAAGLHVPDIPAAPMIDDVEAALDLLDSAIGEFPFVNEASRANAIASILTPLVRPAIDGPTPLALYDAPQAGTGKSLLAEVGATIATGRPAETFSAPTDPEEWRKKITTVLATGTSVVVIDNVTRRLDSDALCMALTSPTIADRMFRTFDKMVLPVRCAWIATGNNIQLGGDMPRRCYWIRLDAKNSQPFRRTGFRHPNLRGWVTKYRGELIAALLTIARYWFLQGQPRARTPKPMGTFESWCETVGGMLETAGVEGFLANADAMIEQADPEPSQWESFLLMLAELFNGEAFRVTDIVVRLTSKDAPSTPETKRLREALPDFLTEAADRTEGFLQRRLGRCFSDRIEKRFGQSQVFVERAGKDSNTKVQLWRVVKSGAVSSEDSE